MKQIRYTLVTDGPTDQRLIPILNWLLYQHAPICAIQPTWAETQFFKPRPRGLAEKINLCLTAYPCDLLFVHRDAEREPWSRRVAEIREAQTDIKATEKLPVVCVVPIRMQEAWLIFDESALRRAAENRNGKQKLQLPPLARLEDLPDPKDLLEQLLIEASGLPKRRVDRNDVRRWMINLPEIIEDYAPLRALSAFRRLEDEIKTAVYEQHWNRTDGFSAPPQ